MPLITTGETGLTCLEACLAKPGTTQWGCRISCGLRSVLDPIFPSRGPTTWDDVEQAIQGTLDGAGEALRRGAANLGGAAGEIIEGVTRPLNVTLGLVVVGLVALWLVLREVG